MKVRIRLDRTSQALELNAQNTYQKGDMFCVLLEDGSVKKYPLANIFEVHEFTTKVS